MEPHQCIALHAVYNYRTVNARIGNPTSIHISLCFPPFESCENTLEERFFCYIEIYWNYYYYFSNGNPKKDLFTAIDALRQFMHLINVEKGPLWVTFTAALDISINLNIKNIVMIIRKCCLWRHLTSFSVVCLTRWGKEGQILAGLERQHGPQQSAGWSPACPRS